MRRAAATLLRLPRGSTTTAALFDAARESAAAASPSWTRCAGVASTSSNISGSSWSALASSAWRRHAGSISARDDEALSVPARLRLDSLRGRPPQPSSAASQASRQRSV